MISLFLWELRIMGAVHVLCRKSIAWLSAKWVTKFRLVYLPSPTWQQLLEQWVEGWIPHTPGPSLHLNFNAVISWPKKSKVYLLLLHWAQQPFHVAPFNFSLLPLPCSSLGSNRRCKAKTRLQVKGEWMPVPLYWSWVFSGWVPYSPPLRWHRGYTYHEEISGSLKSSTVALRNLTLFSKHHLRPKIPWTVFISNPHGLAKWSSSGPHWWG